MTLDDLDFNQRFSLRACDCVYIATEKTPLGLFFLTRTQRCKGPCAGQTLSAAGITAVRIEPLADALEAKFG